MQNSLTAPMEERYYGLVNYGNTCYCNSVLQALYYLSSFRERVLAYNAQPPRRENLLTCLSDLFKSILTQKKMVGVALPKKFVAQLRKENEIFNNCLQHDAHEFLNYLLNMIADLLQEEGMLEQLAGRRAENPRAENVALTWIHEIFQGTLTNEIRCLTCENVSKKDEDFLDLSLDVQQNSTLANCIRDFFKIETLSGEYKYFCKHCGTKQEAQKRLRIKKLPNILVLHLKRFKYVSQLEQFIKLTYRVAFPLELRMRSTSQDTAVQERTYELVAMVVHCGSRPNCGHYITVVKNRGCWLLFDDAIVERLNVRDLEDFYGSSFNRPGSSECGYIFFYQSKNQESTV